MATRILLSIIIMLGVCSIANAQHSYLEWSGCFEGVYIQDHTGKTRKLTREEIAWTTRNGIPGTGTYGQWMESFCPTPNQTSYSYDNRVWPKFISDDEVRALFGVRLYNYFKKHNKARITKTYNFTRLRYPIVGIDGLANQRPKAE